MHSWDEPAEPHEETHWDPRIERARRRVAETGELSVALVSADGHTRVGGAAALFEASPDSCAHVIWIPAAPTDLRRWLPVILDLRASGLEQQFELGAVAERGIDAQLAAEELLIELGAQLGSGSWVAVLPPAPLSAPDLPPERPAPRPPSAMAIARSLVWSSLGMIPLASLPLGILAIA